MTHTHDLQQGFQSLALLVRAGAVRLVRKFLSLIEDAPLGQNVKVTIDDRQLGDSGEHDRP
jgi:hypothetical protein